MEILLIYLHIAFGKVWHVICFIKNVTTKEKKLLIMIIFHERVRAREKKKEISIFFY